MGYVYQYTKPGDNNKFKAFYMESFSRQNLVQIVIHMWETNLPAFFYSPELPDKTFIGNFVFLSPHSLIIFIIVNPNQKIKTHSQKG
jgi:hypothetical protein